MRRHTVVEHIPTYFTRVIQPAPFVFADIRPKLEIVQFICFRNDYATWIRGSKTFVKGRQQTDRQKEMRLGGCCTARNRPRVENRPSKRVK